MRLAWGLFAFLVLTSCQTTETKTLLAKEYYNLGNSYFDLKKYSEAARAYKAAMEFQPGLKIAAMNLIRCLAEQGDGEAALAQVKKLQESEPHNLNLLKMEAYLLFLKGDKPASWELWQKLAQDLPGDADTLYNAALVAHDQKKDEKAMSYLKTYANLEGKNASAYILWGDLDRQNKAWEDAETAYRKAQNLAPDNPVVWKSLGEVLTTMELYGEAVDAYKQCMGSIEKVPDSSKNSKDLAIAPLYFQMGKIQLQAMEEYTEALKSFQSAWDKGLVDQSIWKKLLDVPDLFEQVRLTADLKRKGIYPADPKTLASPAPPKASGTGGAP